MTKPKIVTSPQPEISAGIRRPQRKCRGAVLSVVNLPAISAHIRKAQTDLVAENERMLKAVSRWNETRKYSAVEIGWNLLRAVALHRSDASTRFKSLSTRDGNLSTPELQTLTKGETENIGFYAWLAKEHADIEPRTARNWMNAARNAGLTADSTPEQVAAIRRQKKLAGIALSKLYRSPDGSDDEVPMSERFQQQRILAELKFLAGRSGLVAQLHEYIIEQGTFAHLNPEQIDQVYFKLDEATKKVATFRRDNRREAA